MTFWAKASKSATIDVVGFGNDLAELKYVTTLLGVKVNTNWQKYIIPIPEPSKLTAERGMFYYSEGNEDGSGYTFWIDEVKFENLGTIAHPRPAILEEQDQSATAETGEQLTIGGTFVKFNMPSGTDQRVEVAPSYFTFSSSDSTVARVSELGVVSVVDTGSAIISAKLGSVNAKGSLTLGSAGALDGPAAAAPVPTVSADSVISLFSNAYTNVTVDTWNPFWEFSTAEVTDIQIAGDDVKLYKKLNFVGIEFTSQTIDATNMTHFHLDLWTPDPVESAEFEAKLVDFGADGVFGGDNDAEIAVKVTSPTLVSETWIGVDISLSGLPNRAHVAQLILVGNEFLNNVYVDNLYFYNDGGGSGGAEPAEAAPTPQQDAADVISIFSDSYTNLEGTNLNPDWGQATVVSELPIAGNNTLLYSGFNYQGIELAGSQDVSGMEYLHVDLWTANSSAMNIYLISSGPVETAYALPVPTDGWASVDIPLSSFSPVDLADVIQLKSEGDGDIYLDNIYFYKSGGGGTTEPAEAAPTPQQDAADVISVFSDSYTNLEGTNLNPDWGQATVVSELPIAGNNTLLYSGFNYQGIELAGSQDVSGMEYLHVDLWTANSSAMNIYLISSGPVETAYALPVPTDGWASVDIPLSSFSPVDLADVIQLKSEGDGDIYLDNIYFYKSGGGGTTEPTEAAPTPQQDAADVISVFSDAYTNLDGTNFYPDWGQTTVVSEVPVAGNNTLVYAGLNYQGIEMSGSQNVSGMEYLHVDLWTANSTALNIYLISTGAETPYALTVPTEGWMSVDIPLTSFSPVDIADVIQFKFDGDGDIYLDNIYFYGDGGGRGTEPTVAAPTPTISADDVISLFSNAYTDVTVDTWSAEWDVADYAELQVAGDDVKLYTNLSYAGIEFTSQTIDASSMTHFHMDIWTPDETASPAVFKIKLVDFGANGTYDGGGDDVEHEIFLDNTTAPAMGTGEWVKLDIPLTDFTGLTTKEHVAQLIISGDPNTVYIDNILFHK